MDVAEYKRVTSGWENNNHNAMATPTTQQDTPMTDVQTDQPKATDAPAAAPVTEQPPAQEMDFGRLFEEMCSKLPEDQRKLAISGQNDVYKELERLQGELEKAKTEGDASTKEQITKLQAELDSTKKRSGDMEKMYEDNVKATITAMKNFFEQGAETPNVSYLEGHLKQHPEMANEWGKVVSCAASRITHLESALEVYKSESTKTSEERELFARMRASSVTLPSPPTTTTALRQQEARVTETPTPPPPPRTRPPAEAETSAPSRWTPSCRHEEKRPSRPGNIRPGERG